MRPLRQFTIRRRKDDKLIGGLYPVPLVPTMELKHMARPERYEVVSRELTPGEWRAWAGHGPRGGNPMQCAGCWDTYPQPLMCPGPTSEGTAS